MSFTPGKLAVLAYANSFSLWHYESKDELDQLAAPGYFDEIVGVLRRGDLIFASRADSTFRKATMLLVTDVSDSAITVEVLAGTADGNGATDLDALADVRIEQPQVDQVLAYDGSVWANRPTSGLLGDAHAALLGNPHQTSAADVGAVSLSDKGQPGGVATLDEEGSVPAAQLRALALANLREVVASNPQVGDILKFDGSTWVTAAEAGKAGDAFAAYHAGSGGAAHATACTASAGFLSPEDKQKLDGIARQADANPPAASDIEVVCGEEASPRTFSPAQIGLAIDSRLDRWSPGIQISNAQLAPVPSGTLKGRISPDKGTVEDITPADARRLLNVEDGAVAAGLSGDSHAATIGNPHLTTAADVGAVSVSEKGVANGLATLGEDGKVPTEQLPAAGAGLYSADQIADSPTRVLMTADERAKLSSVEGGATAAGAAGDVFATTHAGAGGDVHAAACTTNAGFMSLEDKQKLDGIAPAAEANPALASNEELVAGTCDAPRLLTPAMVKQAVVTHAPTLAANAVANAALADMSPARLKGRAAGTGIGDPQDLTPAQVRNLINVADGATAAGTLGDNHASAIGNPHQTTAEQVGAIPAVALGSANGVATLDATGKVPAAQLPTGTTGSLSADQVVDTAAKVIMTATERSKLSAIETEATAAGKAGDAFATAHPGSGGPAHAPASPIAAGFMSAADKEKLDGIAPLATPNPPLATSDEITEGTQTEPRLVTPLQIKQAVATHGTPAGVDSIDNTFLANMAAGKIKGRANGTGVGDPQDLSAAQVRTILNVADGAAATPPTLEDADIVAGTATAVGSLTAAKLKLAAQTHGKGGSAFKSIAVSGQATVPATAPEDTLSLVAGANVTLTTDPAKKTVSIAASSSGGGGSAPSFGEIYVAGKPLVAANKACARLELKAGPGIAISNSAASNSITFTTISLGASSSYWNAANPSFGESSPGAGDGGLNPNNTAVQNKAVFTDLFDKMAAAPADNMFLQVPAGTYKMIGSISPSGGEKGYDNGSRLTILFERCVFQFTGSRTDYNQIQYNAGGWKTLNTFAIATKKPFKRGNVVSGRPVPFLDASGYPRPHCVLFDVAKCSAGDKGIDVRGYLELNGPSGSTTAGFVGISAGRADYGFAKGSTWDAVKITGCSVGVLALYITQAGDMGDGLTSSQWNLLDIRGGTRALVLDSNAADMMSIGKATFACQDTSYIFRTHVNIGSAFFNIVSLTEISLSNPNPKIFECMGTLNIGALYARGGKEPERAWSVINVADEGVLNIGCLHGDSNHDTQSGAHLTLAKADNDEASLAGSITLGGTGTDTTSSPISCVVGVAPVANAKRYVNAVAINVPGGGKSAPPVGIIADYGSPSPLATASTNDFLTSFSYNTGFKQQKIANGSLVNY